MNRRAAFIRTLTAEIRLTANRWVLLLAVGFVVTAVWATNPRSASEPIGESALASVLAHASSFPGLLLISTLAAACTAFPRDEGWRIWTKRGRPVAQWAHAMVLVGVWVATVMLVALLVMALRRAATGSADVLLVPVGVGAHAGRLLSVVFFATTSVMLGLRLSTPGAVLLPAAIAAVLSPLASFPVLDRFNPTVWVACVGGLQDGELERRWWVSCVNQPDAPWGYRWTLIAAIVLLSAAGIWAASREYRHMG